MRLDQKFHGALSNELAEGVGAGSSSDSSSPMDDYDEDASDSGLAARDDASATSEASSLADLDDMDDANADDYFNLALGMQDAPKAGGVPDTHLRLDTTAPTYGSMPSTPDASEKKKRNLLPNVFKRTLSTKSVDKLNHIDVRPELAAHDSFLSDNASAGPSEPPSGAATPNAYRRKKFTRRKVYLNTDDSNDVGAVNLDEIDLSKKKKSKKHRRQAPKTGKRRKATQPKSAGLGGYSVSTGAVQNDYLGVVFVEGGG